MTCGKRHCTNNPTEATRVEHTEVEGRPLCDHPGCDKRVVGDGKECADGHVQGQRLTTAGKAGLTTRSWGLVRVYKGMRPDDAVGVPAGAAVQPLPAEGVRCQVCGRMCYAQAVEVYNPELGYVVAGPECSRHLLGNIRAQEFVRASKAAEEAMRQEQRAADRAAEEAEALARVAALREAWQTAHPHLGAFLQTAVEADPENEFFESLSRRLQLQGGLTDGQMGALERAAQGGLDEVRRRGELRESDPAYWRAAEYALRRVKMGYRDPAREILRSIFDRAADPMSRSAPVLSVKQRQLIRRTVKRYARNQLYAWIKRDDPERGRPDFWREIPFVLAVLAAEDVQREPDRETMQIVYDMSQLLYDIADSQRCHDDPPIPDEVALVDATGAVVEQDGYRIEGAAVRQVYWEDGWYAEFALPPTGPQPHCDATRLSPFSPERVRVHVPLRADMQLHISDAHGRPYWWMRQAERELRGRQQAFKVER